MLAARLAAGDDHALAEAFDALGHSVYGSALRVLGDTSAAQDVVQDVFVELWRNPGRYDPAAGSLRTYLAVLARHRAVDMVRSELRRVARQERSYRLTPVPPEVSAGDEVLAAETAGLVRSAVQSLPASQRQVVELAYFEGLRRIGATGRVLLIAAAAEKWHVEPTACTTRDDVVKYFAANSLMLSGVALR